MKLTPTEEYGLRCLLQVARLQSSGSRGAAPIAQIAEREQLGHAHVAKIMSLLRVTELVSVVPGRGGGYRLVRPAAQITVWEALTALGAPLLCPEFCERYTGQGDCCAHISNCTLRVLWRTLDQVFERLLGQITLADLLDDEAQFGASLDALIH